jgi:hypothetical protein
MHHLFNSAFLCQSSQSSTGFKLGRSLLNTTILCVLPLFLALQSFTLKPPHIETVATYTLEQYGESIYLKAALEKKFLIDWLEAHGDCAPQKMISHCGSNYVLKHLNLKINGKEQVLNFKSHSVGKDQIEILFTIKKPKIRMSSIYFHSDYMFEENSHAALRLIVSLEEKPKSYTLKPTRPNITYHFENNESKQQR